MGTDEECMAWVRDEIQRAVGLPEEIGGIPLDKIGATGWGLSHAAEVAVEFCGLKLQGARVAVQGFGSVGKHAARFLAAKGTRLVAASDSAGGTRNAKGLDVEALIAHKETGRGVRDFPGGEPMDRDAIIDVECDIWIPAARPDVVHEGNVARLNTKLVLEGANIPFTVGAEDYLHKKGVLCVPDFIANAGGVICAAMEYQGATRTAAFATIEEKLRENTRLVLEESAKTKDLPRNAAMRLAERRVRRAMEFRRWAIF
jgi:glutamate dehydrogenase (NAD(P)+)